MKMFKDLNRADLDHVNMAVGEILPGGVAGMNLQNGELLFASEFLAQLTGYEEADFTAKGHMLAADLLFEEDRPHVMNLLTRQLKETGKAQLECRLICKNGDPVWIKLFAGLQKSSGLGAYLQFVFTDDTEAHRAQIAVEHARYEMDVLMNTIPGGVAKVTATDGFFVLLASDGFYRMIGYTRAEFAAAPILGRAQNVVLQEDQPLVNMAVENMVKFQRSICVEYRIRQKNGAIAWNTAYCSQGDWIDGCFVIQAVFIDTTEAKKTQHRLIDLTNSIPGGVAHVHLNDGLRVEYASDGFYRQTGYTCEEFMQRFNGDYTCVLYPEDRSLLLEKADRFLHSDIHCPSMEYRIIKKDGEIRWIRVAAIHVDPQDGESSSIECIFTDITESREIQNQLELSAERYRIITEQTQDIIFDWDVQSGEVYHSPVFREKFGYEIPKENAIQTIQDSDIVHPDDLDGLKKLLDKIREGVPYAEIDYRVKDVNERFVWCRVRVTTVFDKMHTPCRAVGIITDIDEYKRETADLQEQAQRDPLTGLLNRSTTENLVDACLAETDSGSRHVLFLIDIDNFKGINDHLGHLAGDMVLQEIALRIRTQFRDCDVLGRVGGDEFAVFISSVPSEQVITQKAEILGQIFNHSLSGSDGEYRISGSIGIAVAPGDGRRFCTLYQKADAALYLSKRRGKNQFSFYSAEAKLERSRMKRELMENTEI